MRTMLLILFLAASTLAQELKPATLTPVRVSIDGEGTADDRDFSDLLQASLNRRGTVRFTSSKFDVKVLTATTAVTKDGRTTGYSAAVATLQKGAEGFSLRLHIATGATLEEVAEDCAQWLDKELSTIRRKR